MEGYTVTGKRHKGTWGVMAMFYILIVVIVTHMYVSFKTHQTTLKIGTIFYI